MASFVLSFFPLDVLDGIWDLIESVSEEFLTYSEYMPHIFIMTSEITAQGSRYKEVCAWIVLNYPT